MIKGLDDTDSIIWVEAPKIEANCATYGFGFYMAKFYPYYSSCSIDIVPKYNFTLNATTYER
jgi:hypothetical protein